MPGKLLAQVSGGSRGSEIYYNAVDKMQKKQVDPEYIQGWIGGYLGNPKREEQRITEPYEAGYEDGGSSDVSKFEQWLKG